MMHQGKLLEGVRMLVVEDEALIAMLVEDMLSDLGCTVVDIAGTVEQGLRMAAPGKARIDAAILDVNVAGDKVFPIAEALEAQGIPFVFATGYGATGVDPRFVDRPVIAKPFRLDALEKSLATALA
jgi:CheY-like chemotaxis protein